MLYVVGLGPGSPDALPARNLSLLTSGAAVLLRTARHPVLESGPVADALSGLPAGVVTALDDEYERSASFEETYVAIVRRVLDAYDRAAREGGELVYAVPGHPLVGEVRGHGLVGAVEFVKSTDPLTAFDPALKVSAAVVRRSRELGVITRALPSADTISFSPPFVVTEAEEIRFDLIYGGAGPRARRAMAIVTAVAVLVLYGMSLPAVVDYVTFMKVERTSYLKIRFDWLFSIYIVFVIASVIRYIWLALQALRGVAPDEFDPTKASSGV